MMNDEEETSVKSEVLDEVDVPYVLSELLTHKDMSITAVLYQILNELKGIKKALTNIADK